MAFERISENLKWLKQSIRDYTKSSTEYYKLELFYKAMKGTTAAVKAVAVSFFLLFAILFLSIAFSVLLSDWIDDPSSGFFIIGGLYLIVGLFLVFFGSSIINRVILPAASRKFFNEAKNEPGMDKEHAVPSNVSSDKSRTEEDERI